ncbi:peptidylprolyl isomerase [Tannockella kyphosi]|uniref:peptidylprolyl isomerase n=1 Tax=Tannockella kyphosi TaxID=2899121 RepID=UPI002012CA55|nr:peptidylprolyl isomerase [Tannockella kyphosi]
MKTIFKFTISFMLALTLVGCSQGEEEEDGTMIPLEESEQTEINYDDYLSGDYYIEIEVEGYGVIEATLYADIAPITVTNFIELIEEGFYDGLTFHRIIDGFMIQGGDPLGNGTGGSDNTIIGEFSSNGYVNDLSHTRGVLSMARSSAYDSASSQFFIMHSDSTYLDGSYAAFGLVTSGMDVVDAIVEDAIVEDSNGTVSSENQPVITSIIVVE